MRGDTSSTSFKKVSSTCSNSLGKRLQKKRFKNLIKKAQRPASSIVDEKKSGSTKSTVKNELFAFKEVNLFAYELVLDIQLFGALCCLMMSLVYGILDVQGARTLLLIGLLLIACIMPSTFFITVDRKGVAVLTFCLCQMFIGFCAFLISTLTILFRPHYYHREAAIFLMIIVGWQFLSTIIVNIRPYRKLNASEVEARLFSMRNLKLNESSRTTSTVSIISTNIEVRTNPA